MPDNMLHEHDMTAVGRGTGYVSEYDQFAHVSGPFSAPDSAPRRTVHSSAKNNSQPVSCDHALSSNCD